ncbi:MAG TPA: hypothetical protein VJL30_00940 [Patescibacteria group bacterium]|nr:hypothetical protein [Patescibacteria group bacterium]
MDADNQWMPRFGSELLGHRGQERKFRTRSDGANSTRRQYAYTVSIGYRVGFSNGSILRYPDVYADAIEHAYNDGDVDSDVYADAAEHTNRNA